jgi:hypothetical protein
MSLGLNTYSKVIPLTLLYKFDVLTLGKFLIFLDLQSPKVSPISLKFRLIHWSTNVVFLQISTKPMVSFANPQICEPYDLRHPISMIFALWSKNVHILHITP